MNKHLIWAITLMAFVFASCSPSRFVKPLKKDQKAVEVDFGGPMINFSGMVIPIPFMSVTGGYGVKENLTAFGTLHVTDLAYQNIHIEFGAVRNVYSNADSSFGVSVTPQINFVQTLAQGGGTKLWPQLDANAYWHYKKGKNNFAYFGMANWFELAKYKAHGELQTTHWVPNFQLGHQFIKVKTDYFVEAKFIAPFSSNRDITVDYFKPFGNNKGAFGLYLGVRKKF